VSIFEEAEKLFSGEELTVDGIERDGREGLWLGWRFILPVSGSPPRRGTLTSGFSLGQLVCFSLCGTKASKREFI
jgi:hypothetical protein